ncbi:MAG: uroporphyrinogen decarboxylase family protein, partial [Candidatus Poribacteria bacterium]
MTHEENYFRTIEFRYPEWIICNVSLMPATWNKYREDLEDLVIRHPLIFGEQHKDPNRNYGDFGGMYKEGTHTDNWGCVWKNIRGGLDAIVVEHPISDWSKLETFVPPTSGGLPHGFMYMRLYYLRGFENLMIDFAEDPPELHKLIDMVLNYNMAEVKKVLENKPKIASFGDDLGNQTSLPMSPEHFRKYLKPCYKKIFGACRNAGAHVYLHSDGHILEIIGDLIECGVTVINPQIRANTLDGIVKECKEKVAVNLDLDRQLFPFCTPEEIDEHVREAVVKLGSKKGGLMLNAECEPDVPLE